MALPEWLTTEYWMQRFWASHRRAHPHPPTHRVIRHSVETEAEPIPGQRTGYVHISAVGVPAGWVAMNMSAGSIHRSWISLQAWLVVTATGAVGNLNKSWILRASDSPATLGATWINASDTTVPLLLHDRRLPLDEVQLDIWDGLATVTYHIAGIWEEDR